jgi:hypothetical protein
MVLPFFIPPFRIYTLAELVEVLIWQGIGTVGWPLAILGGIGNFIFQGRLADLGTMIMLFIYPGMLFLLIRVLMKKELRRWEFILLHFLVTFSFAAVWYQVLNGYDFMVG